MKGKGAGITKIEGSGRKEGREREKTMVALLVFILAGDTVVFKIKNWRNDDIWPFKNLARE